jgi:hypothetical protein
LIEKISFFRLAKVLLFIFTNVGEIYAQSYPKGIVSGQSFLQSASDGKARTINITDFEGNKSVDTIILDWLLTQKSGPLYDNPLVWDVIDNTIYLARLDEDNFGQNFAQLKSYNVIELKRLYLLNKDSLTNYIMSVNNLQSNSVSPLEKYSSIITFKSDSLRGKVHFDMYCNEKSLNLYVYLENVKNLEIWEFTRYPVRQGYVRKDEKDKISEIYKRKQWEKISSQSITIACPFRVFNINQKDYLIDASGQGYQLQGKNIEKTSIKPIQNMENSILIINKNTDELLLIPENKFLEKSSLSVKDKITKFSKKIKVNK